MLVGVRRNVPSNLRASAIGIPVVDLQPPLANFGPTSSQPPIILGDHYSEDTFYYLEDRVRVLPVRLPKNYRGTRQRAEAKIDF